MKPIIYVNSTVPFRAELSEDNSVSTFHYWGHIPTAADRFYFHRRNRYEIILRSKIKGLDLRMLVQVLRDLRRGYHSIYLVTQPDLLVAIPFIKALFPKTRVVTWTWTAQEVQAYRSVYKACDHIFCLTENAFRELEKFGLATKSSVQILGAEPSFYRTNQTTEKKYDVCLLGSADRDRQIVLQAAEQSSLSIVMTERASHYMGLSNLDGRATIISPRTNQDVVGITQASKVAWIPLLPGEKMPAGYTSLIETLLCGVPVVIADSSVIPKDVLALAGVFRYIAGSVTSLIEQTKSAISHAERNQKFPLDIQEAAAQALNGAGLAASVQTLLD